MYAGADHELLRCRGCEMVFYKVESWHSEDWDARFNPETGEEEIYCPRAVSVFPAPAPKSEKPDWAWDLWSKDTVLSQVIDETYAAKSQQLKILTAVGLRTAFDRATLLLGVDEALEFKQKIEQLTSDGRLGKIEAEQIEVLVNAGNAAAHRAWSPTMEQVSALLDVLEKFLRRNFFEAAVVQIGAEIPPRPKRKAKSSPAT